MKTTAFPIGYSATGLNANLSFKKSKKDLALFYSHFPAHGAGIFTQNQVKAAPVILTQERLLKTMGKVRAIIINSGSANAATGRAGFKDASTSSKWVADGLNISGDEVWMASTGVIGVPIRMTSLKTGLKKIIHRFKGTFVPEGNLAAEAIMTTDTKPKVASETLSLNGVPVHIWGCAKGSGMIHPDLRGPRGKLHATMLSVLLTDAGVHPFVLQRILEKVADRTFNCVSIDGDTSTNDFVGLMANGASGAPELKQLGGPLYRTFLEGLFSVCDQLTTQIALDGEGASRLVDIVVEGARSAKSARVMAAVIASSPLVKTACHGADPNWGRVLMAMGRSDVHFDLGRVKIWIGPILVCEHGEETSFSESQAIRYMRQKQIRIRVHLGLGSGKAHYKTCDFTGHYVGINAGYRT